MATTDELKALIPWEVSLPFSVQENIDKTVTKFALLQLQQIPTAEREV